MTTHRLLALAALASPLLVGCLDRPVAPGAEPGLATTEPEPEPWMELALPDGGEALLVEVPRATEDLRTPEHPWVEVDNTTGPPPAHVEMHPAWDGVSVGWSAGGREVWIAWEEGGYHATLHGSAPDDARLLPMLEGEGYTDLELLLVRPGATEGEVLSWWAGADQPPHRMWVAPAPGSAIDAQAFADTVALRYLRTCPGLMETCALYGTPADVEAAVDPVQPLGGWFLRWERAELEVPEAARWADVVTYAGDDGTGASLEIEATPLDEHDDDVFAEHLHRAWLVTGGERVHAFDFLGPLVDEVSSGGVTRDGDRLVTWIWRGDFVSASLSEHDAATGRRLGSPATATAEPYFEVECGYVLYNTRPIPVRTPDGRLSVALYWGTDGALFFAPGEERGHFVSTPESDTLEPWGDEVPDLLHVDPVRDALDPDELLP